MKALAEAVSVGSNAEMDDIKDEIALSALCSNMIMKNTTGEIQQAGNM
jgi:hypothetical protein